MTAQGNGEVFHIPARRCLRCGGLLTSASGLRDGYGHTCRRKARIEAAEREAQKFQITLFDNEENNT